MKPTISKITKGLSVNIKMMLAMLKYTHSVLLMSGFLVLECHSKLLL